MTTSRKDPHAALKADAVRKIVCIVLQVSADDLALPTRGSPLAAHARQVAYHLCRHGLGLSYKAVAREFQRDRMTVCEGIARVATCMTGNKAFRDRIAEWSKLAIEEYARAAQRQASMAVAA